MATKKVLKFKDAKEPFNIDAFLRSTFGKELEALQASGGRGGGRGGAVGASGAAGAAGTAGGLGSPRVGGQRGPDAMGSISRLLAAVDASQAEVQAQWTQLEDRMGRLEGEVREMDLRSEGRRRELEGGVAEVQHVFSLVDRRASSVGASTTRVGERLQAEDLRRQTANEAARLIEFLEGFGADPPLSNCKLAALFEDPAQVAEAARVARKLKTIAEDITRRMRLGRSGAARRNSAGGGGGGEEDERPKRAPRKFDSRNSLERGQGSMANMLSNLEEYCEDLENRVLDEFVGAEVKGDVGKMRDCAHTLAAFDGGSQLIKRYVSTRPLFIEPSHMEEAIRLSSPPAGGGGGDWGGGAEQAQVASPPLGATTGLPSPKTPMAPKTPGGGAGQGVTSQTRALAGFFKRLHGALVQEVATIKEVFPTPPVVVSALVQRAVEQSVAQALEHLLVPPGRHCSAEQALHYVRLLAAAHEKTVELAASLQLLPCDVLDVGEMAHGLFVPHREGQVDYEVAVLHGRFTLRMQELSTQAGVGERRGGAPVLQLSHEVADHLIHLNRDAAERCIVIQPRGFARVACLQRLFETLAGQVDQYCGMGMDASIEGFEHTIASGKARGDMAGVVEGLGRVLGATEEACKVVGAMLRYLHSTLLPMDPSMPDEMREVCSAAAAASMAHAEARVAAALEGAISIVAGQIDRILLHEQKKADFRASADEMPEPTAACEAVVSLLQQLSKQAHASLGPAGPNLRSFFRLLGLRFRASLLPHIRQYVYNPTGGLRLKRDVMEYSDAVRVFDVPEVDEAFSSLSLLVNVLIVVPEALPALIASLGMTTLEAAKYISLREDYKASKIEAIVMGHGPVLSEMRM